MERLVKHEKDIEYFNEYPAPLFEQLHSLHKTNINSTITYLGPMLYFLARALGVEHVLEIGHAEGYTAWYLAHAVKDNGVRFGMKDNSYTGIDIVQTEKTGRMLLDASLPAECINMDSLTLTPDSFPGKQFDLIFQDGAHDSLHVLHEMKVLYPKLKGNGRGFWIFHDARGPAEEAWHSIRSLINMGAYKFEYLVIPEIYGMALLRKIEGERPNARYWNE